MWRVEKGKREWKITIKTLCQRKIELIYEPYDEISIAILLYIKKNTVDHGDDRGSSNGGVSYG